MKKSLSIREFTWKKKLESLKNKGSHEILADVT